MTEPVYHVRPTAKSIPQLVRGTNLTEPLGTPRNRSEPVRLEEQQQEAKQQPLYTPSVVKEQEDVKLNQCYRFPKETYELDGELKVVPKGDKLTGFMGKMQQLKKSFPKVFRYIVLIVLFIVLPIVAPGMGIANFIGLG